jgi:hypothetical protein
MAEELSPEEFEKAKLHKQKIRQIETAIISVLDLKELQASWEDVNLILVEAKIDINPIVWERFLEWYKFDRDTMCKIAINPNPSIPQEVFENLAKESLKLGDKEIQNNHLGLFKALCESKNPNLNQKIFKLINLKVISYLTHISCFVNSKPNLVHEGDSDELVMVKVEIFTSLFSTPNQFAKWKDESGRHPFLQFLEQEILDSLEEKTSKLKVEGLLVVLAKNSAIHTPDLVARLIELSKEFTGIKHHLFDSGNTSVCLKYDTKRSAVSKQREFLRATNYNSVHFEGSQSWAYHSTEKSKIISQVFGEAESYSEIAIRRQEIFNLADTFKNILKALKFYQTQTEQYRVANISALRLKLQDNSFENLIDISREVSVTRLLVDIANYIEKLNLFQKKVTYGGLIQEFEDFVNNFRFDLIENAGTDGRAYQICYNFTTELKDDIRKMLDYDTIQSDDRYNLIITPLLGSKLTFSENRLVQGYIQEGQNPKELVDGLIQIQTILKQLQSKITKIPIVELTIEQIEDKQYLDEAFQDIELFFQVLPDLTTRELFVKLVPNEPIPENIEEFEWLVGYIERERTLKFEKDIEAVAAANLAENNVLTKVLNPIFAPDQSIEFELEYGYYPNNLKNLWDKIQSIQALFNRLKDDKNSFDKSDKRYSIVYKDLSEILLGKLVKIYQEIAYISPNEKLGSIAYEKIQVIGKYLAPKQQIVLDSESSSE